MLSTKPGKEVYVKPELSGSAYNFCIQLGKPLGANAGTKTGSNGSFECLFSGTPIPFDYIRDQAMAGLMSTRMMAIVAITERGRIYLPPTADMENLAKSAAPSWKPDVEFFPNALGFRVANYGMTKWSDIFTDRQLVALNCLHDLLPDVKAQVLARSQSEDYAKALTLLLCMAIDKHAMYGNTLVPWYSKEDRPSMLFGQQVVQMVWDFAEINPLADIGGSFMKSVEVVAGALSGLPSGVVAGTAFLSDASTASVSRNPIVSTDPPYYDNVGYADLSDFFYVWLRHSLRQEYPSLFGTLTTPKDVELVATPHRHGGRENAETFFLAGMTTALHNIAYQSHPGFPVTIYYAFKQAEARNRGVSSTGWETFLQAVTNAGFSITGTWPVRTERAGRMRDSGSNALASSIVLVCRKRDTTVSNATRRELLAALQRELPAAITNLQRGNIAPVDLQQAAIGPGMAIFTRYAQVLDAEGKPLTVRDALIMINQALDEALAHQEGDFDSDTRWAVTWFEQFGFAEGDYGVAETLSKAKNTSVQGVVDAGIAAKGKGKVRLRRPDELPTNWTPEEDKRLTVWDMVHHLIRVLDQGESSAAELLSKLGSRAEIARELAYRLYSISDRTKRSQDAQRYNALVQSWPEIVAIAAQLPHTAGEPQLDFEGMN
jgi:putative DNA methylase